MRGLNYTADYKVIGRLKDGRNVTGYLITPVYGGKPKVITKGAFEQLAVNKCIMNCSAQIYNGGVNLRGIGIKLIELPEYKRNGNKVVRI